jgi:ATP-dependent Clp protease ATP-binding subunit ClpB
MEQAEREGNLDRAAELKYGSMTGLARSLDTARLRLDEIQRNRKMLKEEVGEEDVAEIVARWTGIPVARMLESEKEKILHIDKRLRERVVGQSQAVDSVADAIRRSRAGLADERRPIGSFIFLGSTGVGKTELARALAHCLFDDETALVRIDMSEYMERHSVSRLIGAPPGYVGYDEGGQLTEAVRRRPYSVVLLDEIEKAHPEVFNVLLQVLDDGHLTDNQGRTVNFKNTLIIMTSNIGASLIVEQIERAGGILNEPLYERIRDGVLALLRQQLRPEFLNRVDEVIVFRPLGREHLEEIVTLQFRHVEQRLARQEIQIELGADARRELARQGYDPVFGARPLKRLIQKDILNVLSEQILEGRFVKGDRIVVDHANGEFVFERKPVDTKSVA